MLKTLASKQVEVNALQENLKVARNLPAEAVENEAVLRLEQQLVVMEADLKAITERVQEDLFWGRNRIAKLWQQCNGLVSAGQSEYSRKVSDTS